MKLKEIVDDVAKYPNTLIPTVYDGIIIDAIDMILDALDLSLDLTSTQLVLRDAQGDLAAEPIELEE